MGILSNNPYVALGNPGTGYQIQQSLRFDGSGSKLVLASPSSSYTTNKFTLSCWVKLGPLSSPFTMMNRDGAPNNVENTWCIFNAFSNNVIVSYMYTASINGRQVLNTAGVQRDPSAWYHVVFGYDSGTGNTQRIWVNGVEQTNSTDTISGVAGFAWSSTYPFVLGGGTSHAYCAEYHFVDGTWLNSPDDFGEYNDQGVWVPKEYTGSHGTNGFYLKFDPSATNGIGHDHSGTGNHLTPTGFTTSGTGTDVMSDTPTTNWCTLNAAVQTTSNGKATLSEGNLVCSVPRLCAIDSTFGVTSGKYYWEVKPTDLANSPYGPGIFATGYGITHGDTQYLILTNAGALYTPGDSDNKGNGWGPTYNGSTDVIGLALDMDNHTLGFNKNGGSFTTYDFSAYITSYKMADVTPCWKSGGNLGTSGATFNFGQRAFEYTPPTGFDNPLNTSNLPAPTIKDGSNYFQTVLDTGANILTSAQSAFTNGLWWIKDRPNSNQHQLVDSVRGGNEAVWSPSTAVAGSYAAPTGNSVAWCWSASNTFTPTQTGGLTSLSGARNTDAGFSIVSYTGSGVKSTFTHGLDQAPEFFFIMSLTLSGQLGAVYHFSRGAGNVAFLRQDYAFANASYWDSGPDGTSITIDTASTATQTNNLNDDYVCYAWHSVPGYSKFGSYTGNQNADGPFIFCGFRPAYVWLKGSTFASNWNTYDSARDQYNITDDLLRLNSAAAEVPDYGATAGIDLLSNGFKIRTAALDWNTSGATFVFCAFAENPFGGFRTTPVTAR